MDIRRFCLLLSIALFSASALEASRPVMTGGTFEITVDNLDAGGAPVAGYTNGATSLMGTIGEPGGITTLTGGLILLTRDTLGRT